MDINLNLYNMGLSTASTTYPLWTSATTCAGASPAAITCVPSVLGFYLTFYNSNTATSTTLFADAFVGFVEFTPVPAVANTGATNTDNILVALNQKAAPPIVAGSVNPTLTLTNYGTDWTATAFNTLNSSDGNPTPATDDDVEYVVVSPKYKTKCDEMWQVSTTAVQCVRVVVSYTSTMTKKGSSGTTPTDIDIPYDEQKVGAGWNLYKAGSLTSTMTTAAATSSFYSTSAPF